MLTVLLVASLVATLATPGPCSDINNLPSDMGILTERCLQQNSPDPTTTECQMITFPLGDSGSQNIKVNCGNTFALGFTWEYKMSNNTGCDYYNFTYYLNNVNIYSESGCYQDLKEKDPYHVSSSSCGTKDAYQCDSYITIGSGIIHSPSFLIWGVMIVILILQ